MFTLEYLTDSTDSYIDSNSKKTEELDETDLLWRTFMSRVVIKGQDADLSPEWGWTPALNIAIRMSEIANALENNESAEYEFTESDATLNFSRSGDTVKITSNYAEGAIEVKLGEFQTAADAALSKLYAYLVRHYNGLDKNPTLQEIMKTQATS